MLREAVRFIPQANQAVRFNRRGRAFCTNLRQPVASLPRSRFDGAVITRISKPGLGTSGAIGSDLGTLPKLKS